MRTTGIRHSVRILRALSITIDIFFLLLKGRNLSRIHIELYVCLFNPDKMYAQENDLGQNER